MKKTHLGLLLFLMLAAGVTVLSAAEQGNADVNTITNAVQQVEDQILNSAAAEAQIESAGDAGKSSFAGTWWALLPPQLAIVLALITKEVYFSLFAGIVLGGCFAADFSLLKIMDYVVQDGLITSVEQNSGIFIFLVLLGMIVALINKSGAALTFGNWAKKHVKTRMGSQLATFFLGILIFIDDYFNCLTVGNVMMPLTDKHRVSRAKLAFIIDVTAAPICMIAPISSWAAAVSQYADNVAYSGIELFIRAIPYNFYSLLSICFVLTIILFKLDYGSMALYEKNAMETGNLFTLDPEMKEEETAGSPAVNKTAESKLKNGGLADLIIPVILLIVISVFAIVYVGGLFDSDKSWITAFSDTDATVALPWAAVLTAIVTVFYMVVRRIIRFTDALKCLTDGFNAMVPAILILILATSLKNMTSLLESREFIANCMNTVAPDLANFLPVVFFFIAAMLAFSTGTSWGTFGILIPIVVSVFDPGSPLLFIGMSACLAGAVCGDHCSPISDTTIMASAGAGCDHMIHVTTQFPYVITLAVISGLAFLLQGFVQNWFIVFPVVLIIQCLVLLAIRRFSRSVPQG